jgi:hypothetical protein
VAQGAWRIRIFEPVGCRTSLGLARTQGVGFAAPPLERWHVVCVFTFVDRHTCFTTSPTTPTAQQTATHWAVGLAFPLAYLLHRFAKRRQPMERLIKSFIQL